MTKDPTTRRTPANGKPADRWTDFDVPVPSFLRDLQPGRPSAIRRVGTVRTLCPRKHLGVLIDAADGSDALFTFDDISAGDREVLREGDSVTYVSVIGPDGKSAVQVERDRHDLPPPPSEILQSRGWR